MQYENSKIYIIYSLHRNGYLFFNLFLVYVHLHNVRRNFINLG